MIKYLKINLILKKSWSFELLDNAKSVVNETTKKYHKIINIRVLLIYLLKHWLENFYSTYIYDRSRFGGKFCPGNTPLSRRPCAPKKLIRSRMPVDAAII